MEIRKTIQWSAIAFVLVCVFFVLNVSLYFDFTEDDPGISFRYAAHLFDGKGLVYNAGERSEGYSNFGYVVLMGFLYKCMSIFLKDPRVYLILCSKLVNLASAILTLAIVYRFSVDILKNEKWKALLTVLLVASNGAFAINTASPMETATFTTLLMFLTYLIAQQAGTAGVEGNRKLELTCVSAALVFSVWRIDAPVLLLAGFASYAMLKRFRFTRGHWLMFGSWFVLYAAYTLFRYLYFGELLNNPCQAKVSVHFSSPLRSDYSNIYFTHLGDNSYVFLLLFVLAAACDYRKYLLPCLLVAAQWVYISLVGGDWMTGFRFWAPLTPHICILLVGVIDRPFISMPAAWDRVLKTLLVLSLAAWWAGSGLAIYRLGGRQPGSFWSRPGGLSAARLNPYWQTAQWLNSHVRRDAVMVISEAGFVPFLTDLSTIDTYGLCNRELARAAGTRGRLGLKLHWNRDDPGTQYVLSRNPDVIVLGPQREAPPALLDRYVLVATPEENMHVYVREDSAAVDIHSPGGAADGANTQPRE